MANLTSLKDDTFDTEVLQADQPVLVDFSATWCGPCKALTPTLEALAGEYSGKMRFFHVDVDEARATAQRFGISSVPTMMFFRGGEVMGQVIGNRPKSAIAEMIQKLLEA